MKPPHVPGTFLRLDGTRRAFPDETQHAQDVHTTKFKCMHLEIQMIFLIGIVFVLLHVFPLSFRSTWEKMIQKAVAEMLLGEALNKNSALKHSRNWGTTSEKEKSRGVEMLQNTAVK